jgi:hypothetical protein
MNQIDSGRPIPAKRNARKVACLNNKKIYPVKILISWGHEVALGQELDYDLFVTQEAVKYLTSIGFSIIKI